jgi:fumarate reductase flavoprotein subunit
MSTHRRDLIKSAAALAAASATGMGLGAPRSSRPWDLIVVGGGNAGLPTALFAAQRKARVLIIDPAAQLGGTLHLSTGQMSAAGTKLQRSKGIIDTPQSHYDDIMRLSGGTADPELVRLAVFNAAPAFDWLTDHGFQALPEHPITGTTHDPYSAARYAWGAEGGRSILNVLLPQLQPFIDSGQVQTLLQTEVVRLLTNRDGSIRGVETTNLDDERVQHLSRHVALTCGGYTDNREMYLRYEGQKNYSQATYPFSQGAGYTLGESVGGYIRGGDRHIPLFGAVLASTDYPAPLRTIVRHFPPDRPPYEIYVNKRGERFFCEDIASHTVMERSLGEQPDERCWVVFDDAILHAAPPLAAGFGGRFTQQELRKLFFDNTPLFYQADSVGELARRAGLDVAGLEATVRNYNRAQQSGFDRLGRRHMPLPLAKPPYFAIRLQSWALTSYAGLAVDGQLRVIRPDGRPIGNLYAAGELLGMGQLMGNAVCGGMSVTPALALGRLLGLQLGR